MNAKKLILLVLVAVVLVGLAVVQQRKGRVAVAPERTGQPVLASLPVNDVARIVVSSTERTATVARAEEVWVSKDRHDYPADFSKVRQTLLTLSDLKIGQVLQLNDEQRRRLKLAAPGDTNTPTAAIDLYRADGSRIASLQLGEEHKRQPAGGGDEYGGYPDGRYVSADGGKTVVLVADTLSSISDDPMAWLDAEVANVNAGDVEEVSITAPDGDELVFRKRGNDMVLDGLADDEEMDSGKNYSIKSALSYLRFKDVADPALTDEQLGLSTGTVYRAVTTKGEIYTATVGNAAPGGEDRYVRLSVALKPQAAPAAADTNATDTASATNGTAKAANEAQAKERKELEEKVAKANAKVSGWTYIVAKYQADSMGLKRAEVVKKKETKTETTEPPATAPATAVEAASEAAVTHGAPAAPAVEVVTPPVAVTNAAAPAADAPVK